MMSWSCDRRLPCCCFHEYLWVLHVRHQPIAAQACVKTALCAKGADGMVIRNRFAWYSAHVHVRLWIWKYFVCWCACHFDHMFKVHVWIGVNVQFPARGWHICMRECVCGWGQGLMRAVCVCLCMWACRNRGVNVLVNWMLNEERTRWAGSVCECSCVCLHVLIAVLMNCESPQSHLCPAPPTHPTPPSPGELNRVCLPLPASLSHTHAPRSILSYSPFHTHIQTSMHMLVLTWKR